MELQKIPFYFVLLNEFSALDFGNGGFIPNVVVLQQDLKQAPLSHLACVFFMLLHSLTKI